MDLSLKMKKYLTRVIPLSLISFVVLNAFANDTDSTLLATHEDIEVFLLSCTDATAKLEIQAKQAEVFYEVKSGAGKFLRTMKYIVPSHCDGVKKVKIKGTVAGELWYAAATSVEDDWRVTSIALPLSE